MGAGFYRGTNICILMYDVNNENSFASLDSWKEFFLNHTKPSNPENYPFVLIGNKIDLEEGKKRVITTSMAKTWSEKNNNIPFFEISSKTGENIEKVFNSILATKMGIEKEDLLEERPLPITLKFEETPEKKIKTLEKRVKKMEKLFSNFSEKMLLSLSNLPQNSTVETVIETLRDGFNNLVQDSKKEKKQNAYLSLFQDL